MKNILKFALVAFLAIALVGCGSNTPSEEDPGTAAGECEFTVGLVTDTGGIDDRSFNQSAWEGLQKWAEEAGAEDCISYLQSSAETDYEPNLRQFGDDGTDLIVAVGYLFDESIKTIAPDYPESHFLVIDTTSDLDNVASAVFASEQGSFLVGVAAALKAQEMGSDTVGFIGGMESDLIMAFQAGYEQGVEAVDPNMTIYVDYANSFEDVAIGQSLAQKQYDAGASVIYHAAGNVGNGVINEAQERVGAGEEVWVIGVDRDQYEDGMLEGGESSVILTSMIKRVDTATYTVAKAASEGNFTAEIHTYNMAEDGVGAETTEGRNLSADIIEAINGYRDQIVNGEIEVGTTRYITNGEHGTVAEFRALAEEAE